MNNQDNLTTSLFKLNDLTQLNEILKLNFSDNKEAIQFFKKNYLIKDISFYEINSKNDYKTDTFLTYSFFYYENIFLILENAKDWFITKNPIIFYAYKSNYETKQLEYKSTYDFINISDEGEFNFLLKDRFNLDLNFTDFMNKIIVEGKKYSFIDKKNNIFNYFFATIKTNDNINLYFYINDLKSINFCSLKEANIKMERKIRKQFLKNKKYVLENISNLKFPYFKEAISDLKK